MKWETVILITVIAAVAGALILAAAGFIIGAGVADERAGEAAMMLMGIGAAIGLFLGEIPAFVICFIIRLIAK
jgi:hypothetical protein